MDEMMRDLARDNPGRGPSEKRGKKAETLTALEFECPDCGQMLPLMPVGSSLTWVAPHFITEFSLCRFKGFIPEPKPLAPPEPVAAAAPKRARRPSELCKGGSKPREGCISCGNLLYMTVTGREGFEAPKSYEAWRDEYVSHGLPWALDRMLDLMRPHHAGILSPGWRPEPSRPAQPVPHAFSLKAGLSLFTCYLCFGFMVVTTDFFLLIPLFLFLIAGLAWQEERRRRRRGIVRANRESR